MVIRNDKVNHPRIHQPGINVDLVRSDSRLQRIIFYPQSFNRSLIKVQVQVKSRPQHRDHRLGHVHSRVVHGPQLIDPALDCGEDFIYRQEHQDPQECQ